MAAPARPLQSLRRRLERDPPDFDALYAWFDGLVASSGADQAVIEFESFSRSSRSFAPALVLGYCAFAVGRGEEGVAQFKVSFERRPTEQTLYGLSSALLGVGRTGEAIELLHKADQRRRLATRPLVSLANAYAVRGQFDQAAATLRRIGPTGRREWGPSSNRPRRGCDGQGSPRVATAFGAASEFGRCLLWAGIA